MIEHNKEYYYSIVEITNMIHENKSEIAELKQLLCSVYSKCQDYYFTHSYIESKIYPAIKNKKIRYATYKKENGRKDYYIFRIKDIEDFLKNPLARNIQQKKWVDVKIVEPDL